jgi:hypothetical protein
MEPIQSTKEDSYLSLRWHARLIHGSIRQRLQIRDAL